MGRCRRVTSLKRIVRAHMQRLDSTWGGAVVVIPVTKVGETKLGGQSARRAPLPAGRYRRWRKLGVHWRCCRAGGYGYRDRAVLKASNRAGGRWRASLRDRLVWMVALRVGVSRRRVQGLRHVLALGVSRRVRWWRGGQGILMARQILRPHWVNGHLCLLRRILHASSPVPSPLLWVVWGSHWRIGHRRRCVWGAQVAGERGERA